MLANGLEVDVDVYAKPNDDHYGLENEQYKVTEIDMGQYHTSIGLDNGGYYNSVHFDYFHNGQQINIYRSRLFCPYFRDYLPDICYEVDED